MGSELQMNYTCMGDTVNLCARLESGAKHWGIDAQVSESVYNQTKEYFIFRKLGSIQVKGKKQSVNVYQLICKKENQTDEIKRLLEQFEKARQLYLDKKWDEAIIEFTKTIDLEFKDINPSLTYITICNEYKKNPPLSGWDGTYIFNKK